MISFPELGLGEKVLKAIDALGFQQPTPIQQQAIPLLLTDKTDFIGLAQTGTGKTAAFGLPLIEKVDFSKPGTQALILAPTRELCVQITNDLVRYSRFTPGASVVAVYGGASITTQMRQVKNGAQIIVATPGRLIDLIGRKSISLKTVRFVVLDEADEMLNMGFQEDIDDILSTTPEDKNIWLFSATMPSEVRAISTNYMKHPKELTIGKQNEGADNLDHHYYVVHERDRYTALKRILDGSPDFFGLVFCRTKRDTQQVAENLIRDGYNADSLHGDLSQPQRDKVMSRYRNRSLQVLVATDVAARGIDVKDITHVIHYHLPDEAENYTHRSGRTARAGKSGLSLALINVREMDKLRQIERKTNKKFRLTKVPDALQIGEQQLMNFIQKIRSVKVNEKGIEKYLSPVYEELNDLTKEDLIKKMVSIEFSRFLEDYRNAPDVNVDLAHPGKSVQERYRSNGPRMFINLGSADGFDKGSMLGYLLDMSQLDKSAIGKIDIKPVYSFIEIEDVAKLETALKAFEGELYNGRKIRVDNAAPGEKKSGPSRDSAPRRDAGPRRDSGSRRDFPPARENDRPEKRGWGEKKSYSGNGTKKKQKKQSW